MLTTYKTGLLQAKAYRNLKGHLSCHLGQFNLTLPEWAFLGMVYDHKELRLSELAKILDVEAPFATTLADTLQKKGLIKRREDTKDRRAKVITLSAKGKDVVPKIEESTKVAMRNIVAGSTPTELQIYLKMLNLIVENFNADSAAK
jgi:DNA-binding MarR family transcriptional regulator